MPHTIRWAVQAGVCGLLSLAGRPLAAQAPCPGQVDSLVARGWERYHSDTLPDARRLFAAARARCPHHRGALTGLAYVELRSGDVDAARSLFDRVLAEDSASVDALGGLGIIAWRAGDMREVARLFTRVRALDPANATAADYLARLPDGAGPAPPRPPLVLPDSLVYPVRTHGDYFEVRVGAGWRPFYIKAVNLGAALPGRHPSEFPDSATYAGWIADMAAMDANAVRVYTIHPPAFYQALDAYNDAHARAPLYLIHGVWTELPPEHDYDDASWSREFFTEMRRVVDLLHGRADITPRPGHASGHYTADVSRWTLGYIIGREWEPFSIIAYNKKHAGLSDWRGRYLIVTGGTPADVWMARACEEIIAYETDTYRTQHPVAYTNWPTLDPLPHPTETTVDEEIVIRRARRERIQRRPLEYDNDAAALDASLVSVTGAFPAGYFASYHAYPYYPDFMILDAGYGAASSSEGRSNYFGYLTALKAHHPGMPVVISEYGVPTSLGIAHLQPQGWHHGGHAEAAMAAIDARLTREIAEAGMAGGGLFAWIDEWFKKNWIAIDFEIPLERNRLWLNRLDAEQQYGVIAMEPPAVSWDSVPPLYGGPEGAGLRVAADEAYLHLVYRSADGRLPDRLLVGFDLVDPDAGETRWPGRVGPPVPVGIEIVLQVDSDGARVRATPRANLVRVVPVRSRDPSTPFATDSLFGATLPPGAFAGRYEQRFNHPYRTASRDDGVFQPLRVVTNRPRFARDGREFAGLGYDRGLLPHGPLPDGMWEVDSARGRIEVRIPWMLLDVSDPSQRRIIQDAEVIDEDGEIGTVSVSAIRIVAAAERAGRWEAWPASGARRDVAPFTWPTWEVPRWVARRRPLYQAMHETYAHLEPAVLAGTAP